MDILELKIKNLKEQKEQIIKNESKVLQLKIKMSDLTIHNNVAQFAHAIDEMLEEHKVSEYLKLATKFKDDENVQEYIELRRNLNKLENEIIENKKKIQKDLKKAIKKRQISTPNIYYGRDEKNNVITKNITTNQLSLLKESKEVILPTTELKSKKNIRHFYNRISFKYLEQLVNNNDYSLEKKDLGRVKKLIKKN